MKTSRSIQTAIQVVGATGDIVLFLAGYFMGTGQMVPAAIAIVWKVLTKLLISELMYRRQQAVIKEGFEAAQERGL